MSKKIAFFLHFCLALGLTLAVISGACKALAEDDFDPDYLMSLPEGVIVRYETGKGSYVPWDSGLEPGEKITKPADPSWPNNDAAFGGWYKDDLIFYKPWDFDTDTIPAETGKFMTLYAKWEATEFERYVPRNYIWNNQSAHIMGQLAELDPGEEYTLYIKYWMQGGNASQINHLVAFCLNPETGEREYSVKQQFPPGDLWAEHSATFTAANRWYVVGVYPGLATTGGGTFYIREMKLTKDGSNTNILRRADFRFGVGLDEEKTLYTQGSLSNALTTTGTGKSDSFLPGTWYFATTSIFSLVREQSFWSDSAVTSKISSQSGAVYLDDRTP
jgi:hypothetical protein